MTTSTSARFSPDGVPTPALEVRDLHFRYADGQGAHAPQVGRADHAEALRGVSFSIADGEAVALIGPNGAGKSTLLLHLNGLLPEARGERCCVYVQGKAVAPENLREIRRQVGLLFQDPNDQLFCPTVFEDVAFGPEQLGLSPAEVRARVAESLSVVGLAGFEQRAPHHLSVGQKRRVCLAGVLACKPSILVLDEPTSNLDPRTRREVRRLLGGIAITKLIATHDLEFAVQLCPRVIVLDQGVIVAQGPTPELLADEDLMLRHGLERPHILDHVLLDGQWGHPRRPVGKSR